MRRLELQGGIYSSEEAQTFLARPWAEDALRLRKWDDRAKEANRDTPSVDHFLRIVGRLMEKPAIV